MHGFVICVRVTFQVCCFMVGFLFFFEGFLFFFQKFLAYLTPDDG
jgi:hypothetical protein